MASFEKNFIQQNMNNDPPDFGNNFGKKIIFVSIFFTIAPIALLASIFSLVVLINSQNQPDKSALNIVETQKTGVRIYASLPAEFPSVAGEVHAADSRTEIIRQYLNYYNSPLEPHSSKLVEEADKNGLDFRLLTAIAQQESNLCKKIPEGSNNCWGWGIHSRGTLGFSSFEEGIEIVSKGLKESYVDKGLLTLDDIMSKYTPLSPGTWSHGVSTFMEDMR